MSKIATLGLYEELYLASERVRDDQLVTLSTDDELLVSNSLDRYDPEETDAFIKAALEAELGPGVAYEASGTPERKLFGVVELMGDGFFMKHILGGMSSSLEHPLHIGTFNGAEDDDD